MTKFLASLHSFFYGVRINLLLVLISTASSAYLCETVVITVLSDNPTRIKLAADLGVPFDKRSKHKVITELRRTDSQTFPNVYPSTFIREETELFPLGHLSQARIVVSNESGSWVSFRSDHFGFNNPVWMDYRDTAVVLIGDSYGEGTVDSESNIGAHLNRSGIKTTNLARSGMGPLSELATLREYGESISPKIVLWLYCEKNDLWDLANELGNRTLSRYFFDTTFSQNLQNRQSEIDSLIKATIEQEESDYLSRNRQHTLVRKVRDFLFLTQTRASLWKLIAVSRQHSKFRAHRQLGNFQKILIQAKDLVSSWGGTLYFVYLTHGYNYAPQPRVVQEELRNGGVEWVADNIAQRGRVLEAAKKAEIPLIDTQLVFLSHEDPMALFPLRYWWGHYNESGYRLVADQIFEHIHEDLK